ncbi:alpha/beta hydrolase [Sphingomonas sp. Leaf4]|uniref:alpha/beta hydrolase n=1 Tax=Sphingomonas sp. Leaf4 TaxID=2876553 RepID=UPI001E340F47|nr:alpha/beta fold hydrolase [Sphingomonas sp. Leaf4]
MTGALNLMRLAAGLCPALMLGGWLPPAGDVRPARITERPTGMATEVRIASEPGVTLAGTLHLPAAAPGTRVPLAVLVQGHGRNGRGGYGDLIRRLNADGIAALEYDKRGVGQSSGTYQEDLTLLTADAAAAVAAMRARGDIDGWRIAVVGHSQGGVVAPAVAAADPGIAAVVTLAGSVGDGLPYLTRAIRHQMIAAGRAPAVVDPAIDAITALLQARIDRRDMAAITPLRIAAIARFEDAGFSPAQAQGALAMIDTEEAWQADRLRSASDLKALHVPVLAVFGEKDPLISAAEESAAARAALRDNPRGKVVVLAGLSHWFQDGAVTGGEDEVARLGPNFGSPRAVALVGDWLDDALSVKR